MSLIGRNRRSNMTAAAILARLLTVDGTGSGLDADLLDGQSGAYYAAATEVTAASILTKLLTVDGPGSGLNADLLDGQEGAYYLPAASYTAADVLAKLLTVDGAGTGIDADLLDGQHGAYYLPAASYTAADVFAKVLTLDGAGSGLDADLLDGNSSAYYLAASSYTAADVLAKMLTVDGAGSGLDADLLDGNSSAAFALLASANTFTAAQIISSGAATTPLTLTQGAVTTTLPILNLTGTWNSAGTLGTAFKINVTDSGSLAGSYLMQCQVGGSNRMILSKEGVINTYGSTSGMTMGQWPSNANYGYIQNSALAAGIGNFALLQSSTGDTLLNAASGKSIYLCINNGASFTFSPASNVIIGDTTDNGHKVDIVGGTKTTDVNFLKIAGTWNASGVAFKGILFNVTGTAYAAGSRLIDLRIGNSTRFSIDPNPSAGETSLYIYDADNATLERVTVGAADSGGAGFKCLRIPN